MSLSFESSRVEAEKYTRSLRDADPAFDTETFQAGFRLARRSSRATEPREFTYALFDEEAGSLILPGTADAESGRLVQAGNEIDLDDTERHFVTEFGAGRSIPIAALPDDARGTALRLIKRRVLAVVSDKDPLAFRSDLCITTGGRYVGPLRRPLFVRRWAPQAFEVQGETRHKVLLTAPAMNWWGLAKRDEPGVRRSAFEQLLSLTDDLVQWAAVDPDFAYLRELYYESAGYRSFAEFVAGMHAETAVPSSLFESDLDGVFRIDWMRAL